MTLIDKQQLLKEEFSYVDDPQERLALLVDRSRSTPSWPASERTEERRLHACVSAVWLSCEKTPEGLCVFRAEAESALVRGLVVFLCEFYSGATPHEVATSTVDPFEAVGVSRHLTPTRRNGLAALVAAMRKFAQNAA